ncbi:MAG: tRNA glutamyl-Q(34) synthetase GluQRS [Litorimonas sp.]
MKTRFAPSPTGYLHLGHVMAAKAVFDFSVDRNAQCLLRIEDIDQTRCRPEFTQAIFDDLGWLGFSWPQPVRLQSEHMSDYQSALATLRGQGLLYECFKTRSELAAACPAPLSKAELAQRLSAGKPYALRLSIKACKASLSGKALSYIDNEQEKIINLDKLEDIVVARKDIGTSYHIAVTHDDMAQNITHVIRGEDLQDQTPYHVLIQTLMSWPVPIYHHHTLIMDKEGQKLSKRSFSASIASMRELGHTPQDILARAVI